MPVIMGLLLIAAIMVIRTQVLYWRTSKKKFVDDDFISEKDETGKELKNAAGRLLKPSFLPIKFSRLFPWMVF